jgi:TolA-binding protein
MLMQQGWTGFDGRYGMVDAVFNTLPADYFAGLDWNANSEYDNNGGGNSTELIESEIARHEENIAQLEHQLEYIEGSINRTQIQQQIIEERYEIRRLKAMLNGM